MIEHPIPYETLVALWVGELPAETAEPIDEHLFSCDECSAASERLGRIITGLRRLTPPVISHAYRDGLVAQGLRVKELAVVQPTGNEAVFTADLDFYVFALHAEIAGAERVDLEVWDAGGTPRMQFLAVPFDATRGEVLVACQRHYEAYDSLLSGGTFKVFAHTAGERREIGTFAIKHVWP